MRDFAPDETWIWSNALRKFALVAVAMSIINFQDVAYSTCYNGRLQTDNVSERLLFFLVAKILRTVV